MRRRRRCASAICSTIGAAPARPGLVDRAHGSSRERRERGRPTAPRSRPCVAPGLLAGNEIQPVEPLLGQRQQGPVRTHLVEDRVDRGHRANRCPRPCCRRRCRGTRRTPGRPPARIGVPALSAASIASELDSQPVKSARPDCTLWAHSWSVSSGNAVAPAGGVAGSGASTRRQGALEPLLVRGGAADADLLAGETRRWW